jgi:two-component system CheB/CheR fusion protein
MLTQQFIIAIGGSAGSVEALKDLFDHTPCDHASYIIIRHLPKAYKSQLKSVLRDHSQLRIVDVAGPVPVENNTIYIAPSEKTLVMNDGTLHLVPREVAAGNRAVDVFFESLAGQAIGERAIAVVLSGGGFDGTEGARFIKEAGGVVIVQDPDSCILRFMPLNVIESGCADFIGTPSEIPAIISDYVQQVIPRLTGAQE